MNGWIGGLVDEWMDCLSVSFRPSWAGTGVWIVPTTPRAYSSTSTARRLTALPALRRLAHRAQWRSSAVVGRCWQRRALQHAKPSAHPALARAAGHPRRRRAPHGYIRAYTVELGRGCFCFWPSPSRAPGHDRLPLGPGRLLRRCVSAVRPIRLSVTNCSLAAVHPSCPGSSVPVNTEPSRRIGLGLYSQ